MKALKDQGVEKTVSFWIMIAILGGEQRCMIIRLRVDHIPSN